MSDSSSTTNLHVNDITLSDPQPLHLSIKHSSQQYSIEISPTATLSMLKHQLYIITHIRVEHQKLIIPKSKIKLHDDDVLNTIFVDESNTKCMLIGTPETQLERLAAQQDAMKALQDEIIDDLEIGDMEYMNNENLINNPKIQKKLTEAINTTNINFINPPRANKKLLVLDIDYTIWDMKTSPTDTNSHILKRPYTDTMLSELYLHYDFVFWSQTNWRYLEMKLTDMGILTNLHNAHHYIKTFRN